ncbi:MAG: type IV pilus biogenesis/stability protein PilW [Methylococcales bacterium]
MQLDAAKLLSHLSVGCFFAGVLVSCASLTSGRTDKEESSSLYLQLGVRYMDLNKLEIARENLQIALTKDPDNTQVHNAYAFLYEKLKDYQEASEHYKKALELSPHDWSVQNNFGRFLCDQGHYEQGLALLTLASSTLLNDKQWIALTNAGRCQLAMKHHQIAQAYFEQALMLNLDYAPALLEMQKISFQNKAYLEAKSYLKRYLRVDVYTSGVLWIALQTEMALGDSANADQYRQLLLEKFPLSNEAKQLKPVLQ